MNWTGTETNFPLLVRLGANDSVFAQAKADGSDIRFTKADGTTRIPHEIEHWDAAAKSAAIWVLIDEVKGNTLNQLFRMRWGKADAADSSSGVAVFSPANGFVGVWHMSGTADEIDVTGTGNLAVAENAPGSAAGHIGLGRSLSREESQHFVVADNPALNWTTPAFTMSAWVKATDWEGSSRIFQKGEGGDAAQYGLRETSLDRLAVDINATNLNTETSVVPEAGTWALVHAHLDGTVKRIYVNGQEVASGDFLEGDLATTAVPLHIGHQPGGANYFNGVLDELRLQKVARSPAWITLEYESQKADQKLVQVTPPGGIVNVAGAVARDRVGVSVVASGAGSVVFHILGAVSAASVVVSDIHGRKVWSGVAASGAGSLTWDGRGAAHGVYTARIQIVDPQGHRAVIVRRFTRTP